MQSQIKRISRKARRYFVRNRNNQPSRFSRFDENNVGAFLRPDFDLSPVLLAGGASM